MPLTQLLVAVGVLAIPWLVDTLLQSLLHLHMIFPSVCSRLCLHVSQIFLSFLLFGHLSFDSGLTLSPEDPISK